MKNKAKTFLEIISFGIVGGASSLLPPRTSDSLPSVSYEKPRRSRGNTYQSDDDYEIDRDKEPVIGSLTYMRRNIIPMSGSVVGYGAASASNLIVFRSTPGGHKLYRLP